MTTNQHIRRHADGSIDIHFYRNRGLTERRAALDAFVRNLKCLPSTIVAMTQRRCDGHHIEETAAPVSRMAPDPV